MKYYGYHMISGSSRMQSSPWRRGAGDFGFVCSDISLLSGKLWGCPGNPDPLHALPDPPGQLHIQQWHPIQAQEL